MKTKSHETTKASLSGFVSETDKDGLDSLAAKAGMNRSQYLRQIIADFLANPRVPLADNVAPPADQFSAVVGAQVEEAQLAAFDAEAARRGLKRSELLRALVYQRIVDGGEAGVERVKLRPPLDVSGMTPETSESGRKGHVHIDKNPLPWLRMAFWGTVAAADIRDITGCSVTTANRYVQDLISTGTVGLQEKRLVLLEAADFAETADVFLDNLRRAAIAGDDLRMACGANVPVSIRTQPSGVSASVLKALIAAMGAAHQLVDALINGAEDVVRFHPLELIDDCGTWKVRINEFLLNGGLIGERTIPLADIMEADIYTPPKAEPEPPKRRGRKPSKPRPEPEVYNKSDRIMVPAGSFEVGQQIAGKVIAKLGREVFDPEFDRVMQYAYF